jgi:hypothetical protein
MRSTNASSAVFGWDFQSNAAIMLMLKNIKVASAVKVEGKTEDIEITLDSGNVIYSQAKSVFDPYNDYSHVVKKLKAGLKTLNSAAAMPNVEQLIYVTNSPNPFNKQETMGAFSGSLTSLKYAELPESCQNQIAELCAAEGYTFNHELFSVFVMQFHGDGDNRYKVIKDLTNEFLNSVGLGNRGLGQTMLEIWQRWFTINTSQHNTSLSITKKSMVWPLIVSICEINSEDASLSDFDEGDIDQILNRYKAIIDNNSERFEFVTKVLSAYNSFRTNMKGNERIKSFIATHWQDYCSEFAIPNAESDVLETIVKLAISNVIRRRINIVKIKGAVNL